MGKGGPKPAYYALLGDVLLGADPPPDEEVVFEVISNDCLSLPSENVDVSPPARATSNHDRSCSLDLSRVDLKVVGQTADDRDEYSYTHDVECFPWPKLDDHRISVHGLGFSWEGEGRDLENWNMNAHESIIQDFEPDDGKDTFKSDIDTRSRETSANLDTGRDEMDEQKDSSPSSVSNKHLVTIQKSQSETNSIDLPDEIMQMKVEESSSSEPENPRQKIVNPGSICHERNVHDNNKMNSHEAISTIEMEGDGATTKEGLVYAVGTSSLSNVFTKAGDTNTTVTNQPEKLLSNTPQYNSLLSSCAEDATPNVQMFEYQQDFDFSKVLEKLDAIMSKEKLQVSQTLGDPKRCLSCTQTFQSHECNMYCVEQTSEVTLPKDGSNIEIQIKTEIIPNQSDTSNDKDQNQNKPPKLDPGQPCENYVIVNKVGSGGTRDPNLLHGNFASATEEMKRHAEFSLPHEVYQERPKCNEKSSISAMSDNTTPDLDITGDGPQVVQKEEMICAGLDSTLDYHKDLSVRSALQSSSNNDLTLSSVSSYHPHDIEVKIKSVLSCYDTSFDFDSRAASLNGTRSFKVSYLERKTKGSPVFATVQIESCPGRHSDYGEEIASKPCQNSKQKGTAQSIYKHESIFHASPNLDKIVSKLDSITSSLASANSIESKRSALKNSQKTASENMTRARQKVTFHIAETEAKKLAQLNGETNHKCTKDQEKPCCGNQTAEFINEKIIPQNPRESTEHMEGKDLSSKDIVENIESEQCTEDDVDEEVGDDDLYHDNADSRKLNKLLEDASLELDTMDFVSMSNGSDTATARGQDHQCLENSDNGETVTEGGCRSSLSDLEETSLHVMTSMESLPRDEECVDVTDPRSSPGLAQVDHQEGRSTEHSTIGLVQEDKLDSGITGNGSIAKRAVSPHVVKNARIKNTNLDCGTLQNYNETEKSLARRTDKKISNCINTTHCCAEPVALKTNSNKFSTKSTNWGRTAEEMRNYVEEFKSLSSVDSVESRYNENLHVGADSGNEKKTNCHSYNSIQHGVSETFLTDNDHVVEQAKNERAKEPLAALPDVDIDKNDTTYAESATSVWDNSEQIQGIAENCSIPIGSQQLERVAEVQTKPRNNDSQETGTVEIWVVPGSTQTDTNCASLPSQVMLLQETVEASDGSEIELSSQENTSKLDFSKSLSQISQFDMSRLDKSIFTGPSVEAERTKENSDEFTHDSSTRSPDVCDKNALESIMENDTVLSKPSFTSVVSVSRAARVTFDLPSISKQSHCRSQSLPRRQYAARSKTSRRSLSVSPGRFRKQGQNLPQQSPIRLKRSIEIEGSSVCLILEERGRQLEVSKGLSSLAPPKSNTHKSQPSTATVAPNFEVLSTSTIHSCSLTQTEELLTQQSEERTLLSEDVDVDTKCSLSGSSINTHTGYEDKKTMATTIDSFHSHSEEYAAPATTDEDQIMFLENHRSIKESLSFKMPEYSRDQISTDNQQSKRFDLEELDISVHHSQSFPISKSRHSLSSNSEARLSIPKDDDSAWFAYRKQFREFFTSSISLDYFSEPLTQVSDIKSVGRPKTLKTDNLAISVSLRDGGKSSEKGSYQNVSLSQARNAPKIETHECVPSVPGMNITLENISLPEADNEDWLKYRIPHRNIFSTAPEEFNTDLRKEHDDTLVPSSTQEGSDPETRLPKGVTQFGTFVNRAQGTLLHSNDLGTSFSRPSSPVKDLIGERYTDQSDDALGIHVGIGSVHQSDHSELSPNSTVKTAAVENASNKTSYAQLEAIKKPNPDDAPEEARFSNNPNANFAQKTIRTDVSIHKVKEHDAQWFRYRKKWSNLFQESKDNCAKASYKPYVINNTRFRRAMMKEDFDEPVRRGSRNDTLRSSLIGESHGLKPAPDIKGTKEGQLTDAPAMGDNFMKSYPDALPISSSKKCRKVPVPPRESFVGVVLQESSSSPMTTVAPSQDLLNSCDPDAKVNHGTKPALPQKPPTKGRDRSLPRVRHTKRTLDTAHSTSSQDSPTIPIYASTDQSIHRIDDHSLPEASAPVLTQRLVRLPEIQPALAPVTHVATQPLASTSRSSLSPNTRLEATDRSISSEITRSPNARRQKRFKREPLHSYQAEDCLSWRPTDGADETQTMPLKFPISDEAGEGDLLDEASGGFEEGSLLDKDNLLFIKGVSPGEHLNVSEKQESPLNQLPRTAGPNSSNRFGGGDDAGPVQDAVGGLLEPPLDLKVTAVQATDLQVMTVQQDFRNVTQFLRSAIPRKINPDITTKTYVLKPSIFSTETWDMTIDSRTSRSRFGVPQGSRRSTRSSSGSIKPPHQPDFVEQEILAACEAEQERQKRRLQIKMQQQRLSVARLASTLSIRSVKRKQSKESIARSESGMSRAGTHSILEENSSLELSNETKAGGDKAKRKYQQATAKAAGSSKMKHPDTVLSRMEESGSFRTSNLLGSFASKPGRTLELSRIPKRPGQSDRKTGRAKMSGGQGRVLAEGHYNVDTNVVSVVVKPVNMKLNQEQLNLKVQVHRKPDQSDVMLPHPPDVMKPTVNRSTCRRITLRRPPAPTEVPVLASNIIDVRAVNPPFNTTMSPEAHRRFQAIYGHKKVL